MLRDFSATDVAASEQKRYLCIIDSSLRKIHNAIKIYDTSSCHYKLKKRLKY